MNIALDWDGTTSEDIGAWGEAMKIMRSNDHKVYIVTMRYPSEVTDVQRSFVALGCADGIYATGRLGKREFMAAQGVHINVWIDDMPEAILADGAVLWGDRLAPEGHVIERNGGINGKAA